MKKKILIYPYVQEYNYFIELLGNKKDIDSLNLVTFKGWVHDDKTICFRNKFLNISTDFEKSCLESDEVWFVDTKFEGDEKELIFPKLRYALEHGKKIKYFRSTNQQISEILDIQKTREILHVPQYIQNINVPIVLCAGLYNGWKDMQAELTLMSELEKRNYNVIQIGSERHSESLDMYEFPQFMFDEKYSSKDKVLLFNDYVKQLEITKEPELIIIGVPGGVMSYSKEIVGDFGLLFTMVSMAVTADIFVLSMPYNDYSLADISNIRRIIWERFSVYTDYFHIVPQKVNLSASTNSSKLEYLSIDKELVKQKIADLNCQEIGCLNYLDEKEKMCSIILDKLLRYGEIRFV